MTGPVLNAGEWADAQRICDLPDVDAAIRGLLADPTGDNATCAVRSILRAALGPIAAALAVNGKAPEGAADITKTVAAHVRSNRELAGIIHDMVVGNQAAWIEWQHGGGAEVAMEWIQNGLLGPGHIPGDDTDDENPDDPLLKNAQAYYDRHADFGAAEPNKIAGQRRAAKRDTELLNFIEAERITLACTAVPAQGGGEDTAFEVAQSQADGTSSRSLARAGTVRQALGAAMRVLAPQADLFADVQGSAL